MAGRSLPGSFSARSLLPALVALVLATGALSSLATAWDSPATASHAAYGWPTFSDPTHGFAGGALPAHWNEIPERPLPDEITGLTHVARGSAGGRGTGIAAFGSLVVVPGWSQPAKVYDVSEPQNPVLVSTLGGTPGRDADFIAYPDGRLVLVMATDHGIVPVWDLTDHANPVHVTDLHPRSGSHNVGVVPGTPIVYNANSAGDRNFLNKGRLPEFARGITEIYDLTDPANPLETQWRNGYGCHDVTFFIDNAANKYRAYCAGIEMTQIWDVTDPWNPSVITNVPVHHGLEGTPSAEVPLTFFSHLAMVNHDASILIVGDETGGGAVPPGCDVHVDTGTASASGPAGNLWFYDITDEKNPVLKSWISPGKNQFPFEIGTCTAHFGRLVEDRNMGVFGFYSAGTLLVDWEDPSRPFIVDRFDEGSSTWDAWYYNGWVFTGDLARGMDVLTFE